MDCTRANKANRRFDAENAALTRRENAFFKMGFEGDHEGAKAGLAECAVERREVFARLNKELAAAPQ